jgi:hypothetical protein
VLIIHSKIDLEQPLNPAKSELKNINPIKSCRKRTDVVCGVFLNTAKHYVNPLKFIDISIPKLRNLDRLNLLRVGCVNIFWKNKQEVQEAFPIFIEKCCMAVLWNILRDLTKKIGASETQEQNIN